MCSVELSTLNFVCRNSQSCSSEVGLNPVEARETKLKASLAFWPWPVGCGSLCQYDVNTAVGAGSRYVAGRN